MFDQLRVFFTQFGEAWKEWSLGRKLSLLSGMGMVVLIVGSLIFLGSQPRYSTLMANLTPEDAASITARLKEMKMPYKLAAGGTAINVHEESVYELRVTLAGEGLPKGGGVGFEIFDDPSLGMSRFSEQLNYRRALEGELSRTISQIDAVKHARVHVVMPERALFREQQEAATASVSLKLQRGRYLSNQQVQSIVHLVASSVPNLNPDQVTVVDSGGRILSRGGESLAGAANNLEQRTSIERGLENRVSEMLQKIVGAEKVTVRVNAELDFSQRDVTSESFDPESAVVRSEQTTEEARTTGAAQPVQGEQENLIGTEVQPPVGPGSTRKTQTLNYEINKIVSREVSEMGKVSKLSVAVLVDVVREMDEEGNATFRPRSQDELSSIEAIVKNAIGFDASRGDQVEIQSIPFDPSAFSEPVQPIPAWFTWAQRLWRPALLMLLGILAFLFLRRFRRIAGDHVQEVLSAPRTVREMEAAMSGRALASTDAGVDLDAEVGEPDPERAAAVVKTWLSEGDAERLEA